MEPKIKHHLRWNIQAPLAPFRRTSREFDADYQDKIIDVKDPFAKFRCGEFLPQIRLRQVGDKSPVRVHRAVERYATFFKREFGYDFTQYEVPHRGSEDDDSNRVAYLWHRPGHFLPLRKREADGMALGACCFRWREWSDAPAGWSLQWIWFHPFARRQGILGGSWPFLRYWHGDFDVENPVSPGMIAFLKKHQRGRIGWPQCHIGEHGPWIFESWRHEARCLGCDTPIPKWKSGALMDGARAAGKHAYQQREHRVRSGALMSTKKCR